MSRNILAEQIGVNTLQAISAGMTVTSIAGAWGYVTGALSLLPVIIASGTGIAAIISYSFATLDSPSFQRKIAHWTMKRKTRQLDKLRKQQLLITARLQALDTIEHAHEVAERIVTDAKQGVLCPPKSNLPLRSAADSGLVAAPTDTR